METRSNQILVGSITLGLLAALVVFIVWLSQFGEGSQKEYDVFFQQSVEGLAKGSAVTFRGVPVGQIRSINLEPRSPQFIRVRISVSEETPVLEGTTATIRGVGFTGVSQIQLDPPEAPGAGQPRTRPNEIVCGEPERQAEEPRRASEVACHVVAFERNRRKRLLTRYLEHRAQKYRSPRHTASVPRGGVADLVRGEVAVG